MARVTFEWSEEEEEEKTNKDSFIRIACCAVDNGVRIHVAFNAICLFHSSLALLFFSGAFCFIQQIKFVTIPSDRVVTTVPVFFCTV